MTIFKDLLWLLLLVLFTLSLLWFVDYSFSVPRVYISRSTGECIKVVSQDVEKNCSDIPEIYNKRWVK